MLIVVSLIVCGFVAYMLFNNKNMKIYNHYMNRKKKLEESVNFFSATQTYANQNMVIGINQEEKKICISTMKNGTPVPLVYKFNDIISCEIIEYKVNDTTTSINNQVRSQTVGNVLADSVDKVIGNLSGKAAADRINRIDLKISFNDSQTPFVLANFLFWEVSKDSEEYKTASEDVSRWYGIIDNIIKSRKNLSYN